MSITIIFKFIIIFNKIVNCSFNGRNIIFNLPLNSILNTYLRFFFLFIIFWFLFLPHIFMCGILFLSINYWNSSCNAILTYHYIITNVSITHNILQIPKIAIIITITFKTIKFTLLLKYALIICNVEPTN